MNFSSFFISRPIFASVLSVMILVMGLIAMFQLPIAEYPEVSPPSVNIRAAFPGANPKVIAETVAAPLEEAINGVENMLYMSSSATADGSLSLNITFAIGTDVDLAQQMVQNRVSQALPRLPDITRQLGVTVAKSSPDLTMVVHLLSPDERYDMLYLRNFATLRVKDELAKINGVGMVRIFGAGDYAMRIWLDTDKLAARSLNASEVVQAIREQNVQVAAGVIGGPPYPEGVALQLPINARGRLESPEEFADIIIHTDPMGVVTRLKDVARVELGSADYSLRSMLDNKPAVALPIFASPNANAIQISDDVRKVMAKLKEGFPEGVDYKIVYDPTIFVRDSIKAVIATLSEAILLVVLVVILFLQTWRASLIPLLAVPVSIIGTFAIMLLMGFTINVLTLFGMILAIGIVVDDAIIVVENVERNIENGLKPKEAAFQAMREVTGPIIATTLVLLAVFVPIAFVSGLTGQFYKQFSLTIAISTVISAFNSLTLSPALSALLLKEHGAKPDALTRLMNAIFGRFFGWFNRVFKRSSHAYSGGVVKALKRRGLALVFYAAMIGLTGFFFQLVPAGFVPSQDKAYLISFAQLQQGATLERTEEVMRKMSDIVAKQEGVDAAIAFPGLSIAGFSSSSSAGIVFVRLKPFDQRTTPELSAGAIAGELQQKFSQAIPDAFMAIFPPPPVRGLGMTGGFKLQIEDRTDQGYEALDAAVKAVMGKAWQDPQLSQVFSSYQINVPQLFADVDRTKAKQLGLKVNEIFQTMQVYLGSLYVNDFNTFGRTYQVIAQADAPYRARAEDILKLKLRNDKGEMVPLGAVLKVSESYGPQIASRYNGFRAADLSGSPGEGFSSGQAQDAIVKILKETLPKGMDYEWTELTYQQILAGNTTIFVFPLCLLLVFLVLAAQYESLTLPLAVILIVPMALLAAIFGVWLTGGDNNIFTQISFFVLMALATKNAILIVEFARELEHQGMSIVDAAVEACHLRLRPILMTSFAFIMGVLPMVLSTGAGAEMRQAMGIAVFSGMLGVTFFGIFLTPVFYVGLRKWATRKSK